MDSVDTIEKLEQNFVRGKIKEIEIYVRAELDRGIFWSDIFEKTLIPLMDEIGQGFSDGTYFLPELMAAGKVMSRAVEVIKEILDDVEIEPKGTIVIGTIFEDLHDIGKNIVIMNFEAAGFKVIDLGIDVKPEVFINTCRKNKADLVGISALLSSTSLNLETAIKQIREQGLDVKIMIGGNPITQEFAEEIGADGYAPDGYLAVKKARELLKIA